MGHHLQLCWLIYWIVFRSLFTGYDMCGNFTVNDFTFCQFHIIIFLSSAVRLSFLTSFILLRIISTTVVSGADLIIHIVLFLPSGVSI